MTLLIRKWHFKWTFQVSKFMQITSQLFLRAIYYYYNHHQTRIERSHVFVVFFYIYCYIYTISNSHRRFRHYLSHPVFAKKFRAEASFVGLRSILYRVVIPRRAGIFRVIWIPVLAARKVGRSSSRCWRTPGGESLFHVEGISWPCSCRNEHGIVLGTKVPGLWVG
jgi:hypothetical protein